MHKLVLAVVFTLPQLVAAQVICPKGYQPYANRCVTQRMADYISCIEASGGNKQAITDELTQVGGNKVGGSLSASGGNSVAKGAGALTLDKNSESALIKKLESKWFAGGMSECAKALNSQRTTGDTNKKVSSGIDLFDESRSGTNWVDSQGNGLKYETSTAADKSISIEPTMPYLAALRAGEEVHGLQYWQEPFEWDFPQLSVKIVNNSKSTLLISRIEFQVIESNIDERPVPLIHESFYNTGHILLVNEGWGAMREPKLVIQGWRKPSTPAEDIVFRWTFGDSTQDPCVGKASLAGTPVEVNLDPIVEEVNIPVEEYLPTSLQREPIVCAIGTLKYIPQNSSTPSTFKFRTLVSRFNPGPGAPAPPSAEYDLFLRAGKKNYVASVPVSQEIKPGTVDHFLIRLATDKSASFKLKYRAREISDINLGEQLLHLSLFVPRTGADRGTLGAKYFPQLPVAVWGGIPQAKTISRIVYRPDDKSDIRIYLKEDREHINSCDEYYESLLVQLRSAPFPEKVKFGIVDSKGSMFCTSGLLTLKHGG